MRSPWPLLLLLTGCSTGTPAAVDSATAAPPPAWFEDATDRLGITFATDPGPTGDYFMPQSMAAGCAAFDADGDGRADLLFLQFTGAGSGAKNAFYLQNADGTYRDASAGSGLDIDGVNVGVAVGDADGDGKPDVLITRYTGAKLFKNLGGGKFRDVTEGSGVVNPLWGASAAFFDFDRDGDLDLVIVNYIDYDKSWPCRSPSGARDYCGPKTFTGTAARLFRNDGGHFTDISTASGIGTKAAPGLGVYPADLTGDGWPDLFVTNDGAPNFLWVNQKDGTFKEEANSRGVAMTAMGNAYANMGIAAGDYDNDGLTDLFVTHLGSETHTLWRQTAAGLFRDATQVAGAVQTAWRGTGFGAVAADFDLDGRDDIAFVNGRVYAGPPVPNADHVPAFWRPYAERNQLLRNVGGKFADVSAANPAFCDVPNVGRGLAVADLNNDGRPDLVSCPTAGRARVYLNVSTGGHWLAVRAVLPKAGGRDAAGAVVTVRAGGTEFTRAVQPGHSYLSSSTPEALIGLGDATSYDSIRVAWPDGVTRHYPGGAADRRVTLTPDEGTAP